LLFQGIVGSIEECMQLNRDYNGVGFALNNDMWCFVKGALNPNYFYYPTTDLDGSPCSSIFIRGCE
jgi:hypothetical protein